MPQSNLLGQEKENPKMQSEKSILTDKQHDTSYMVLGGAQMKITSRNSLRQLIYRTKNSSRINLRHMVHICIP